MNLYFCNKCNTLATVIRLADSVKINQCLCTTKENK